MEKVFEYGRIIFIKPDEKFVDNMTKMMSDEEIQSMLFNERKEITRDIELEWIRKHQDDNCFSIVDKETLEYIGNCGFNSIEGKQGEIGLVISKPMQGKHYAKEIIKGLIEYGFNELGLDEIIGIIFSDNVRSLNCCMQLGFEEYNREKNVIQRNGIPVDDVYVKLKKR